jgi:hypothetical protein
MSRWRNMKSCGSSPSGSGPRCAASRRRSDPPPSCDERCSAPRSFTRHSARRRSSCFLKRRTSFTESMRRVGSCRTSSSSAAARDGLPLPGKAGWSRAWDAGTMCCDAEERANATTQSGVRTKRVQVVRIPTIVAGLALAAKALSRQRRTEHARDAGHGVGAAGASSCSARAISLSSFTGLLK